jgi:hypothetical protein
MLTSVNSSCIGFACVQHNLKNLKNITSNCAKYLMDTKNLTFSVYKRYSIPHIKYIQENTAVYKYCYRTYPGSNPDEVSKHN